MFAVKPYYLSSSGTLDYSEGYIISRPQVGFFQVEVPLASSIESTMEWCNRVAAKHSWADENNSICDVSGFNWVHYDGLRNLKRVLPSGYAPFNIKGDSILGSGFYTRYRDIVQFMGNNTLEDWGSLSGTHWPSMDIVNNQWIDIQELNNQPKITKEHYHKYIYRGSRKEPTFFGGFFYKSAYASETDGFSSPYSSSTVSGWDNPLNQEMVNVSSILNSWHGDGYSYSTNDLWRDNFYSASGTGSITTTSAHPFVSIGLWLTAPKSIGFSEIKEAYRFIYHSSLYGSERYGSSYQAMFENKFAAAYYPIDMRQAIIDRTLKHLLGLDILGVTMAISGFYTPSVTSVQSIDFGGNIIQQSDYDVMSHWYGDYKLVFGSISMSGSRLIGQGPITYTGGDAAEAAIIGDKTAVKLRNSQYYTLANINIPQPTGPGITYSTDNLARVSFSPYVSSGLMINPSSTYMDIFTPGDNTVFFALIGTPFEGSGIFSSNFRVISPNAIGPYPTGTYFHTSQASDINSDILSTRYREIYASGITSLGYNAFAASNPLPVLINGWASLEHHSEWW